MGTLKLGAALSRVDLLAPPVAKALAGVAGDAPIDGDQVLVAPIDPDLADTAAFCAAYEVGLDVSANCVVVAGKRDGVVRYAACIILATTRADVNGVVRRRLDVRKASFAPMADAVELTGMEYGGITPIGLPARLADPGGRAGRRRAACDHRIRRAAQQDRAGRSGAGRTPRRRGDRRSGPRRLTSDQPSMLLHVKHHIYWSRRWLRRRALDLGECSRSVCRLLRAGDRVLAGDHEGRHAGDAEFARLGQVGARPVGAAVGLQVAPRAPTASRPSAPASRGQRRLRPEVDAVAEVRLVQGLDHLAAAALVRRPRDQPVRVERVGGHGPVEVESQPVGAPRPGRRVPTICSARAPGRRTSRPAPRSSGGAPAPATDRAGTAGR